MKIIWILKIFSKGRRKLKKISWFSLEINIILVPHLFKNGNILIIYGVSEINFQVRALLVRISDIDLQTKDSSVGPISCSTISEIIKFMKKKVLNSASQFEFECIVVASN